MFCRLSRWNPGAEVSLSVDRPVPTPGASDTSNHPSLSCYYLARHPWTMAATRRSPEVHPQKGCSCFGRIRILEGAMLLPASHSRSFSPPMIEKYISLVWKINLIILFNQIKRNWLLEYLTWKSKKVVMKKGGFVKFLLKNKLIDQIHYKFKIDKWYNFETPRKFYLKLLRWVLFKI